MTILNISTIIPLDGLKRENDIILTIQKHMRINYNYNYTIAKSLPYANMLFAKINKKWNKYRFYQKQKNLNVQGYNTVVYPWLLPPTSNFWFNYLLLPLNYLWYKFKLEDMLLNIANNCDLILAQNIIPDAVINYWIHLKTGKPYILNIRGKQSKYLTKLPFFKKVFIKASMTITHSPINYRLFKNYINVKLILHPVDDIFFSDTPKKYSTNKLISVCRLLSLKHIDWIIDALSILRDKGYKFEYKIVGDGPEMLKLKSLVRQKRLINNIIFEGFREKSDVKQLLNESHIFIMPSYPETLGRAFLEAAASGCLLIGHKNTGVDGLFMHNKSAVFVEKKTIKNELENVFKISKSNDFKKIVQNSKSIVENLTWEKIGQEYKRLFERVTNV